MTDFLAALEVHALRAWLHRLPQELFDEIEHHVFTIPAHETADAVNASRTIDEDYAPPSHLQVNSRTRQLLSSTYYSNTRFIFPDVKTLEKWLESVSVSNIQQIRVIHIVQSQKVFCDSVSQNGYYLEDLYDDRGLQISSNLCWRDLYYKSDYPTCWEDSSYSVFSTGGGQLKLADFLLRIGQVRSATNSSLPPLMSDVKTTFPDEEEWEEKVRKDHEQMLSVKPSNRPIHPRERQVVIVDSNYKTPSFADSEWETELSKSYHGNSFFMVQDIDCLDMWFQSLRSSTICSIRRIHMSFELFWCLGSPACRHFPETKMSAFWALVSILRLSGRIATGSDSSGVPCSQAKQDNNNTLPPNPVGAPSPPHSFQLELSFDGLGESDETCKQRRDREMKRFHNDLAKYQQTPNLRSDHSAAELDKTTVGDPSMGFDPLGGIVVEDVKACDSVLLLNDDPNEAPETRRERYHQTVLQLYRNMRIEAGYDDIGVPWGM